MRKLKPRLILSHQKVIINWWIILNLFLGKQNPSISTLKRAEVKIENKVPVHLAQLQKKILFENKISENKNTSFINEQQEIVGEQNPNLPKSTPTIKSKNYPK